MPKPKPKTRPVDAIKLLEADHAYVKKAFKTFEKMDHADTELMNEAAIEHGSAKTLIRQIERMKPRDPMYAAAFTVLGEYVQHHVKEEESGMFAKARRARLNRGMLGEKLLARKTRLMGL
jgi:hypothetical protein